jgi:hypothetical protein
VHANKDKIERFMSDLVQFEVCRNDLNLRTLLQINAKLEEEANRRKKYQSTSISLLRIAKKNAQV